MVHSEGDWLESRAWSAGVLTHHMWNSPFRCKRLSLTGWGRQNGLLTPLGWERGGRGQTHCSGSAETVSILTLLSTSSESLAKSPGIDYDTWPCACLSLFKL